MADRGVIIEFDFAAMNGAELLFNTTKALLNRIDGIPLDLPTEAKYLMAGGDCLTGLAKYFAEVKTKKTAVKAAKDVDIEFKKALTAAIPAAVTASFCNFVAALADCGVKVVISTRADIEAVDGAFADILSDNVVLYHEESTTYGSLKWDAWRRAAVANKLSRLSTYIIAGSGYSVKSALIAGMGATAVVNDHVAYQDFTGADAVIGELSAKTAKKVIEILNI